MGRITTDQIEQIVSFLDSQGITFEPIKNELLDHLLLDIEAQLKQGKPFEEAFSIITQQLAKHQLLTIEQEAMEAISKQSTLTTRFSYLGLVLLLITTAFKLLHLPGTTLLLFSSIGAFIISLLTGAITGIIRYKDKLGSGMLLAVIAAVILFTISWAMLILQLPGDQPLRFISATGLIITFSIATYQFGTNKRFENSILSYLHEKYSPGIERILLIVLSTAGILKIIALLIDYPPNVASVLLIFVISGGVLHFYASQWPLVHTRAQIVLLISTFIIGMIPNFAPLANHEMRITSATIFYGIIGWMVVTQNESSATQKLTLLATNAFYLIWSLTYLHFLPETNLNIIFNPIAFIIITSGLIVNWSNKLLRIYFIMVIAHYLLEYPSENGLAF